MKFLDIFKKKQKPQPTSISEPLPPPPSLKELNVPQLPSPASKPISKPRFPAMPQKSSRTFEDRAYQKEKKLMNQRETLELAQPLFIRGEQFRDIVADINEIKAALKKVSIFTDKFEQLHNIKETKFEHLRKHIETIQRKLIFMDKTLFK